MKNYLLFLCLIFLLSCKKKPITEIYPEFIGTWIHYESAEKFKYLTIESDSKGDIYYSNGWKVYGGTQTRKWLIKKDNLHFGWTSASFEKFAITTYPTIAIDSFIVGVDTVDAGQRYIELDGDIYANGF